MEYNGITLTEDMVWAATIISIVSLIIRAFYCLTLSRTLKTVAEENRHLKPWMVWMALVPIVSLYWNFIIANRMADSLTNEFYDRKIAEEENPGRLFGLSYAIFVVIASFPLIPSISFVAGIFALYYFIRYWVKIDYFRILIIEHQRFVDKNNKQDETSRNNEIS